MADKVRLVSNTQIYLDSRKLLDEIINISQGFPREFKYVFFSKMNTLAIDLLELITAAYMNRDRERRIQYLVDFQTKFETLKTLIRIAGERKWIKGKGRHAHIVELMDGIGKQSTAWKNSLIRLESQPESRS